MSNNDARELAMKSLVYFCFGITLEEDKSTIIDSIVSKAYFDATQQGAFNTLLSDEGLKKSADAAKKSVRDSIVEKLSVFKAHKDIKSYDDWHESICTDVLKKYKDINDGQERFTYGNAQKILNMTMKYLYMLANIYGDECQNQELRELFSEIKKAEAYLHVPIDSYIIDAIWDDTAIELPIRKESTAKRDKFYARPSEYVEGWSTWNDTTYLDVQNGLREHLGSEADSPIVWEEKQWIAISKKRKNSKNRQT